MAEISMQEASLASGHRIRRWRTGGGPYGSPRGAHATIEIAFVHASTARYDVGRRVYEVGPASVMIVPAGVEHTTTLRENTLARSLHVSMAAFDAVAQGAGPGGRSSRLETHVLAGSTRIGVLAVAVDEEAFRPGEGQELAVDALMEELAFELASAGAVERRAPAPPDVRIRRALDCVHARYADPLSIEDLALAAAMSRFHFSRMFRENVGMSPYRYLIATRVNRAAALLRSGRCNVTEAARDVGFEDLGRFIRAFRTKFGVSPGEFAKATASGNGVSHPMP